MCGLYLWLTLCFCWIVLFLDFSKCLISVSLICPANLTSFCFMSTSLSTLVLTVLTWAQTNTAQPLLYGKALANRYDPQWKFQTELTLSRLFIPLPLQACPVAFCLALHVLGPRSCVLGPGSFPTLWNLYTRFPLLRTLFPFLLILMRFYVPAKGKLRLQLLCRGFPTRYSLFCNS